MHISQLRPAQEIRCWTRLGCALQVGYNPKQKNTYYKAPVKAGMARSPDLTNFGAWVISNDPVAKVITLRACGLRDGSGTPRSDVDKDTSLHYSFFRRIRLLSAISYPGKVNDPKRPTDYTALSQTSCKPYRTLTEVTISW